MDSMTDKEKGILTGFISATIGTILLIVTYWLIWFTPKSARTPEYVCLNVVENFQECVDSFVQWKIIFSFVLPFVLFAPVGYLINATSPEAAKSIRDKKWMYSSIGLATMSASFVVYIVFGYEDVMRSVVEGLFILGVGMLVSIAWTVFFYNRAHPSKTSAKRKKK